VARAKKRQTSLASLPISVDFAPMEARLADALPHEKGWQFELKWDGFRCLAFRAGDEVDLRAKSGKPLARYFPEVVAMLRQVAAARFVLDGELAIPRGEMLSFEDLQLRLHPAASRVKKLAAETPAVLILFDMLVTPDGESLVDAPLRERRAALERFYREVAHPAALRLSPMTRDHAEAVRWLKQGGGGLDGVVAKRLDGPYESGERAMLKVKRMRTADCVVGGFRYESKSRLVGSLLLGLYNDEGKLDHVGFTAAIHDADRAVLTKRLENLVAPPGFTGNAPGGPSRWSTDRTGEWEPLKPKLVVEVRYDHVTGNRFRHGTKLLRWRPDKSPKQCTFDQIEREARPGRLAAALAEGYVAANIAIDVDGVRLSHPEKVLYPEQGITKRALADYYRAVADWILPHVARRPISLVRCPAGRQRKCFFQRHAGSGVPAELSEIAIEGFAEPYLFIRDERGLVALVQMGVLEIHPWGALIDRPDRPDRVIFDLDPGDGLGFADVMRGAREVRDALKRRDLRSFVKTTGGKGLHVIVPIARRYSWADVKSWAKAVATAMAESAPERYLTRIAKAERKGRIFIDYLRNDPTSTAVAPYSTRARAGAPVATPVDWDELTPRLDPAAFTIATVPARLTRLKADPWREMTALRQRLSVTLSG